jgi:hypothetical protein
MSWPCSVNSVISVNRCCVAFATPKSMTLIAAPATAAETAARPFPFVA